LADLPAHIKQAKHNQACASFLLVDPQSAFRDWAITTAFYAAVHYAEACFTTCDIGHTPEGANAHAMRAAEIRTRASKAWVSYRKLQTASYELRYLAGTLEAIQTWQSVYTDESARRLVQRDLEIVKVELAKAFGVSLD
jgi:hypothetical protein